MTTVTMDKDGIVDFLRRRVGPLFPEAIGVADMVQQSVTIANGVLRVQKKLPVGNASLTMDAQVVPNGAVELNIKLATVLGSSLFGTVRKIAGDFIIKSCNQFAWMQARKASNGNIQISVPGVYFQKIALSDRVELGWEVV